MNIKKTILLSLLITSVMFYNHTSRADDLPDLKFDTSKMSDEDSLPGRNLTLGDKMHFFGYGEVHYNNNVGDTPNQIDFHRFVLGWGYDFNKKIKLKAELDFEHAFKEPELEFAYLDFLHTAALNYRLGAILLPMGVLNQHHEPPLFNSVERPLVYRNIIPTSWQGAGGGIHGLLPHDFNYELYILSSLNAVEINEDGSLGNTFSGSEGFHDDHSIGEAPGRDFGLAARLEYKGVKGLRIGASNFIGNTGQGNSTIKGGTLEMASADAKYSFCGIDLEGIVAYTHLSDARNINKVILAHDPTFNDYVATEMFGWYGEAAYHVLHAILPDTNHDLIAFGRYEKTNTQLSMPTGFANNTENNRDSVTFGLSYLPIPQVALKSDYTINWSEKGDGVDQFNLGVGFYY